MAGFVARPQLDQVLVSTINRDLATLRRMFHLAIEWGRVKTLPRIELLPGENHRERIPASQRIQGVLEMRKGTSTTDWIFPATTASGRIEASTLKTQQAAAIETCGVEAFVLYTLRPRHSIGR